MVVVAAEIVLHRLLNLQRQIGGIDQRLLDRRRAELGHVLGEIVARIHVSRMVPVVMDHHGLRIDVRLKRVVGIAQRRELERAIGRLSLCEGGGAQDATRG